ncbi:MAG: hypothetical protein QXQ31_06960, partial [Zestosphaera sp.]
MTSLRDWIPPYTPKKSTDSTDSTDHAENSRVRSVNLSRASSGLQTKSTDFLRSWFVGFAGDLTPLMLRAFFWCVGDLRNPRKKSSEWGGWSLEGLDDLVRIAVKNYGNLNLLMSFGFWLLSDGVEMPEDPEAMLYDRLFYDFDSKDHDSGVDAALEFASILDNKYGATPLVVDSGLKGAHVYVFLSEPVGWEDFRVLWEHLIRQAPEEAQQLVDRSVVSTHKKLARVPLTHNVKEGKNVITRIIYPKPANLSNFSLNTVKPLNIARVKTYKFKAEIGKVVKVEPEKKLSGTEIPWVEKLKGVLAPCMKKLLEDCRNGINLSHNARVALAAYMLNVGYSVDEVVEVFRTQPDYNERVTRYQVNYIASYDGEGKPLIPYSCAKMKEMGLCVRDCGTKNPLNHNKTRNQV